MTLQLPVWLAESFNLARVIANEQRWSWSEGYRLLERFEMASHERAFVKTVLPRRTNLRLFRSNQRLACGDFIAIDMSSPVPARRAIHVMELKTGEPLVLGGARLQCARYRAALDEISGRPGVIDATTPVELLYGDATAVLVHLGVLTA